MKNVFENMNITNSMNEQIRQLTDRQSHTLEPMRAFAATAADTFEQIARKNYAVLGDVLEFSTRQVRLPLSSENVTSVQTAETKEFLELMNSRATEYSDMAQQFQAKAKEATESVSASFK